MNVFVPLGQTPARGPRQGAAEVSYLLVNPPMTDPTTPYHSIPYLVGATREAGYDAYRCVDANLEALDCLARPERFGALLEHARSVRAGIELAAVRSRRDEIRYRLCLDAEGLAADSVQGSIAVLRDPEKFYDYPVYRRAVTVIERWLHLLALDLPIGLMDAFDWRAKSEANLCSSRDLADAALLARIAAPFEPYLATEFATCLRERPWAVVGFSVNYTSQLPVALHMARLVRAACPDAVIVFGGTETGDMVKYLEDRAELWRVFEPADLIVPGEGESALVAILDAVREGRGFAGLGGVIACGETSCEISYENVAALPGPAYDVWEWDRYWSPEPVVLYSPTRGCYWNKCTFCDYGLNTDKPTSPSRERPLPMVLDELAEVSRFARVVYFAVDAMSPRYLRTLAERLAETRIPVSWSAELRLERTWPKRSIGRTLRESGCVAISFGYESGSQRVLDLIDKGVRIDDVPAILKELSDNEIAAQMMGFTGFPSETADEAARTYTFLHEQRENWTLAGIGSFGLTPGSIVAKQPGRFGVATLPTSPSDDVRRYVPWRDLESGLETWLDADRFALPEEVRRYAGSTDFDRPFVGGIDSTHSLLYFARFGHRLWPDGQPSRSDARSGTGLAQDAVVTVPFESVDSLTGVADFRAEIIRRTRLGLDSTSGALAQWLEEPGSGRAGASSLLVLPDGRRMPLPTVVDPLADGPLLRALKTVVELRAYA